jgi:hypothetical protein
MKVLAGCRCCVCESGWASLLLPWLVVMRWLWLLLVRVSLLIDTTAVTNAAA